MGGRKKGADKTVWNFLPKWKQKEKKRMRKQSQSEETQEGCTPEGNTSANAGNSGGANNLNQIQQVNTSTPTGKRARSTTDLDESPITDRKASKRALTGSESRTETADGETEEPKEIVQSRTPRYDFLIKSDKIIDLAKLMEAIRYVMPPEYYFTKQNLSQSQKVILFKVECNPPTENPNEIVNHFLKNETKKTIQNKYGEQSLQVSHYDPTSNPNSTSPNPLHVIVKQVPIPYSTEYFLEQIKMFGKEITDKVQSCQRMKSRVHNAETGSMRLECTDIETAQSLISKGMYVGSVFYRCERPHSRPSLKRCFRCQELGHFSYNCQAETKCGKCGSSHDTRECQKQEEQYRCIHCKGRHGVWSMACPANIDAIKAQRQTAENQVPPGGGTNGNGQRTYASAMRRREEQPDRSQWENALTNLEDRINERFKALEKRLSEEIEQIRRTVKDQGAELDLLTTRDEETHETMDENGTRNRELDSQINEIADRLETSLRGTVKANESQISGEIRELREILRQQGGISGSSKQTTEITTQPKYTLTPAKLNLQERKK